MAVLGALGLVSLRGLANDVYCQIGLVMLIGLSAKNSILIVEFAEQLRRKGRSISEAAIEAAELRLRPILMTSFAFILGVLPLVFATGAGALGRRSVGTTIVGGMLLSTVLNLVFIPVLYVILSRVLRRGDVRVTPAQWESRADKPGFIFKCIFSEGCVFLMKKPFKTACHLSTPMLVSCCGLALSRLHGQRGHFALRPGFGHHRVKVLQHLGHVMV